MSFPVSGVNLNRKPVVVKQVLLVYKLVWIISILNDWLSVIPFGHSLLMQGSTQHNTRLTCIENHIQFEILVSEMKKKR